ncbi:MAG TPA: potassium transporter Kup [Acidimicrobiales bacterium]|nr:potassium transporter Kup [Acidimicrobiales bacterium]
MAAEPTPGRPRTGMLALGALGVVFGDIGTSPLYAFREAFEGHGHELDVLESNVLGVLSLVFWSLVIVISVKYLALVMRADSHGEGGILTLTSLVTPAQQRGGRWVLVLLGLFGTALLYGDGMITPAISVLSAVEGTTIAAPALADLVLPITIAILIAIFSVQRHGTHVVGRVFGPIMVLWFAVLGVLGARQILAAPRVLEALDPLHGVRFFADNGLTGILVLGAVFLVVTGGEALYADMGHFGHRPIAIAWFAVALPGLVLNYFGQGALLLEDPSAIDSPFYRLAPDWALVPMVVLATAATVIASQALISGAFSLTMQAVQLGYAPRLRIVHTSGSAQGQIYVPTVNWVLMVACIGLVLGFRSSSSLAAAYGIAVTTTMVITTVLFAVVARTLWEWSLGRVLAIAGGLLVIDLAFFAGNVPKIPAGGWFPIVAAAVLFALLTTWSTGRRLVRDRIQLGRTPLVTYLAGLADDPPARVPGTAVYLFSIPGMTPPSLVANVRYNRVLHERVVVASVVTDDVPRIEGRSRLRERQMGDGVSRVDVHYGFMEDPDLARDLAGVEGFHADEATYFLGKETVIATKRPGMAIWRERLFGVMGRNATSAADYFRLPPDRIFEVGTRVEI